MTYAAAREALARALADVDPAHARRLARLALEDYAKAPGVQPARRRSLVRWLGDGPRVWARRLP